MNKLELRLIGRDSFQRQVYQDIKTKRIYKNTDCIHNIVDTWTICTCSDLEGEPNLPLACIEGGYFDIEIIE